jgi:hypothetical protein
VTYLRHSTRLLKLCAITLLALGISHRGKIVVFGTDIDFNIHGFVYDHGAYTFFDVNPNDPDVCVDPPGVVGTAEKYSGNKGSGDVDISFNAHVFFPTGINDRGQIVGDYLDINFQCPLIPADPRRGSRRLTGRLMANGPYCGMLP